jgi:hypothetical protein
MPNLRSLALKGETLAISIPSGETAVLKYFQEPMPYGLFVPDVPLTAWTVKGKIIRRFE